MSIYTLSYKTSSPLLEKCTLILNECIITLNSLLKIHDEFNEDGTGDQPEKQDLLRAMFVFSAGGLDSLIKQSIKDSLSEIIEVNVGALNIFTEYVEKDIQNNKKGDLALLNHKLLAQLLTSHDPRNELKKRLVYELTSSSLQSKDQILKIASYFDIPSNAIVDNFNKLHTIFQWFVNFRGIKKAC